MNIHFDLLAPFYDLLLGNSVPQIMIEDLKLSTDQVLLEIGGGTGRIVQNFQKMVRQVWMVDPSISMLRTARSKYPDLRLVRSYAEDMPFPSNVFDRVIIYDSLHHWENQITALYEVHRVMKPGAMIYIVEINPAHRSGYFIKMMEELLLMGSQFLSPTHLIEVMDELAFEQIRTGWIDPPTYFLRAIKSRG